jgi:hypothetical protein
MYIMQTYVVACRRSWFLAAKQSHCLLKYLSKTAIALSGRATPSSQRHFCDREFCLPNGARQAAALADGCPDRDGVIPRALTDFRWVFSGLLGRNPFDPFAFGVLLFFFAAIPARTGFALVGIGPFVKTKFA